MGEKQIRIRQSPLNPPDCATTISRLITNGMNGRQIYQTQSGRGPDPARVPRLARGCFI